MVPEQEHDAPLQPNQGRSPVSDRLELAATVLLALAAVATAWSSYQAARWNGQQATASSQTNAIRIEAARAQGLAQAQKEVDVMTFTQWVNAYARGETELASFYFRRFRAEFRPAVEAWVATKPLENPDAPLTPFAMPQYRLAAEAEARRLDAEAEASSTIVRRNVQRATNYVLGVVLFAVALFFAGIGTKPSDPRLRVALVGLGCVLFAGTAVWIATSPVSISV